MNALEHLLKISASNRETKSTDRWTDGGNRSVTKSSGLGEKAAPPCTLVKSRKKRRINSECRSLEDWTDLSRRTANSRDMGEEQTLCSPSHGRSPPIMRLLNCTFVFILFRIRTFIHPHPPPLLAHPPATFALCCLCRPSRNPTFPLSGLNGKKLPARLKSVITRF